MYCLCYFGLIGQFAWAASTEATLSVVLFLLLTAILVVYRRKLSAENLTGWGDNLRSLLESIPSAIALVDPYGRIVVANSMTEELFGYEPEELFWQYQTDLTTSGVSSELTQAMLAISLRTGNPPPRIETEGRHKHQSHLSLVPECAQMGVRDRDLLHGTCVRSPRHNRIYGCDSIQPELGSERCLRYVVPGHPGHRDPVAHSLETATPTGLPKYECTIVWQDGSRHTTAVAGHTFFNRGGIPQECLA